MATDKKARKKVASKSVAAVAEEPKVEVEKPKVEESKPKTKAKSKRKRIKSYTIHLIEGASYGSHGHNFVRGRPFPTTDPAVYELFKNDGRLKIDVKGD